MNKSFFLLMAMLSILTACTQKQLEIPQESVSILNSRMAMTVDGQLQLTKDQGAILAAAQEIPAIREHEAAPVEAFIEEIDGKNYLRIMSSDNFVTNIELIEDAEQPGFFNLGTTTCSSVACAHCCGCLPQGDGYCSKCTRGVRDCSRSSSSSSIGG